MRGRATVRIGEEDEEVRAGDVIFVPALTEHRFHKITEDLSLLVLFSPPEGGAL